MNKLFIVVLFAVFSFNTLAVSTLRQLVEKKADNYLVLGQYYKSLLSSARSGNDKLFCQDIYGHIQVLNTIYSDDLVLIKTLRTSLDSDHLEFATHLEENSFSPLFSSASHRELCDQHRREDILRLTQSLEYHVMNIDYLSMTNILFLGSLPSI